MKINLLDAGLARRTGHHFDHCRKLVGALLAAGHEVHVYGYHDMSDDVARALSALCPVTPRFRAWQYDLPASKDGQPDVVGRFNRHAGLLLADLRGLDPADVWIWPTILPQHLFACARLDPGIPLVGSIHLDPGIAQRTREAGLWQIAIAAATENGLRAFLGSIEPELCARFAQLVPGGMPRFPQPYGGPPRIAPRAALKRIGIFGQQREMKGFRLMEPLLDGLTRAGYEVVYQDSEAKPAPSRHPRVEVLGYVENLAEHIARCDLVVLPYEIEIYRLMGSGILAECLALGVPVTGPATTMPGNTIARHGVGPLFEQVTPQNILAAVDEAARDYSRYAANAVKAGREAATRDGAARYAEALLAGVSGISRPA